VPSKTIAAVISDLMFQSRVSEQARALGHEVAVADTPAGLQAAVDAAPALVVLDLHVAGLDWRDAVALAKERGVPVLAFGRHTEAQLLRAAREAGCDRVVPRSQLVEELPQLIQELAGART
jgi:CheY-like chemotaxis protein